MRYVMAMILASTPALAEVPRVVTDIPPVHALVAKVMGDLGAPELLLTKGADEHDFQLRPSQAAAVADADLVVWIGPDLTPWLDSALETRPEGAAALPLLMAEGTVRRDYADPGDHNDEAAHDDHAQEPAAQGHADDHAHGHDEAHGHEEKASASHDGHDHAGHDHAGHDHADHDHAGHDHSGTDPHAWLDPGNTQVWLGLIAAELSRLDPENAARYAANAAAATAELQALDAEVAALLAPLAGKPIVTFHDAYGYFGAHYGLNLAGSIALGDAASPGAARLADLRATMETGAVLCIFPEVQHDPALVDQMAEGTGAKVGGALDPVGSSLEPGPDAYATLIRGTAQTIADCLTN